MSLFVQEQVFEDPFVLDVVDVPEPHAGPGEVRVRVAAAGLNPVDWKVASNPAIAAAFGVSAPAGFGHDLAGTVDEVGDGISEFRVGDRVFGGARGRAVAEYVVVNPASDVLRHTPDDVSDTVASTLVIAGRTADAALTVTKVAAGDTVVIGGAAGGVGVFAVQLAALLGATVIATASEQNHDFLRSLGAIPVTYGSGLAESLREAAPDGIDAAIDLHGIETVDAALALGIPADRIATVAAHEAPEGVIVTGGGDSRPTALEEVAEHVAAGRIVVPIAREFPVADIADAVALVRGGHVRGKVVVTI